MTLDFDTFLVALYTKIDDLYLLHFAACKPRRPGPRPKLSDSEVLTLAICAQWSGRSEREVVRYAHQHWRSYFPNLLSQSETNRRIRDVAGLLVCLVPLVGAQLGSELAAYQVMDGMPVPLMRKCRGKKHRLFADEAGFGIGGSDREWYYGCRVLLAVSPDGVITGFVLASAGTQERWLADYLLCWRLDRYALPWEPADLPPSNKRNSSAYIGPKGSIWPRDGVGEPSSGPYLADSNFSGPVWTDHWAIDYGANVITPKSYEGADQPTARRQHACWRHVVETVIEHLEHVFHLPFPGAHSRWGLLARVGAKLAAFNFGLWLNRLFERENFAFATLFTF